MITAGQPEASGRLQRALTAFQRAQGILLATHRKLKELPTEDVDRFWAAQGKQIERYLRTSAAEVVAAFDAFSAAGLVASAGDRHLVSEAQRIVAEGAV